MPHVEHLQILKDNKERKNLPEKWVPPSMLYAFVEQRIVGRLSVRFDENVPSWKIIEKFEGILENKIYDLDEEEYIRRYWVNIK